MYFGGFIVAQAFAVFANASQSCRVDVTGMVAKGSVGEERVGAVVLLEALDASLCRPW